MFHDMSGLNDWHEQYLINLHCMRTFQCEYDEKMVAIGDLLLTLKKIRNLERKDWPNVKSTRTDLLVKTNNLDREVNTFADTFNTLTGADQRITIENPFLSPEWMQELSITNIIPKFRSLQQLMEQVDICISEFQKALLTTLSDVHVPDKTESVNISKLDTSYADMCTNVQKFLLQYDHESHHPPSTPQCTTSQQKSRIGPGRKLHLTDLLADLQKLCV